MQNFISHQTQANPEAEFAAIAGRIFPGPALLLAIAALMVAAGCDVPRRPPVNMPRPDVKTKDADTARTELVEPPTKPFDHDWETWEAYYLRGKHVGYSHIVAKALTDESSGENPPIQYLVDDQLRFRRRNATFVQHFRQESMETSTGQLLEFDSTLNVGPLARRFHGEVQENQLKIESTQGASRTTDRIAWEPAYRGLVGVQQSLRRKPMVEGERRLLKALSPIQYKISSVELYCTGEAGVPDIDGEYQKLFEIAVQYVVGETILDQTLWTNKWGEIKRTHRPVDGLVSYHTSREKALSGAVAVEDLLKSLRIDVVGALEQPKQAERVEYVVRPQSQPSAELVSTLINAQPGQYLKKMDDGSLRVLVALTESGVPGGYSSQELLPTKLDLTANRIIDHSSRMISQLATAAGKTDDKRRLAINLNGTVRELMKQESSSQGLTRASEIANSPQGGCIEHSVFLAALLRAREIPSRLAIGFVYEPGEIPAMAFDVWTLAHVDGKWLSLDPMSGELAPADRITIATTDLSEADEYREFKKILPALGDFAIEIIEPNADQP